MAFTRYLGWILLPILVWSVGGAWIEGERHSRTLWVRAHDSVAISASCDSARVCLTHPTPCILEQLVLLAGILPVQARPECALRAGFTKSHFQQDIVMDTSKPSTVQKSDTDSSVKTSLLSPPSPADLFAAVNSNPTHQYKNSLNSTHYMLYHEAQPTQQKYEPYTYGFLTTMARIEGKMKRKKPMAVTFIGGSVTAAYCKEPGIGCWVTPVSEWLMEENPQVITDSPPPRAFLHSIVLFHVGSAMV